MAEKDNRFKFIKDAFGISMEAGIMQKDPFSAKSREEAWSAGLMMGHYFQMDNPDATEVEMMEALRDKLPDYRLEPEVADIIVQGALLAFEDAMDAA